MSEEQAPEAGGADSSGEQDPLQGKVVEMLKTIYDPEIPVDIYELGLIYKVDVADGGTVAIEMTLTSPMCPVAESLPPEVEEKVGSIEGVEKASVEVVWDPPFDPSMMSDAARLTLNM